MCEGLQDLFFYCSDWAFHNVFLNLKKLTAKKKKKRKRQIQEQYMAFFLRHIVLNGIVWLKLKHVFRRLRRMCRHNDLKDSLSQVLHFILRFILIARKPPPQRLLAVSLPLECLPFSLAA